jgi:glycosyltransferase involved in cell wall biosynthesis
MSVVFPEIHTAFQNRKVCVLIPTYNNAQTLSAVITSIAQYTSNIVVVNDGSTDHTEAILKELDVDRVSYPVNKGKGWALRQGFKKAVTLDYDYAITIDSDGQHYADDLSVFIDALEEHPHAVLIGTRNMNQVNVPNKSNVGNRVSSFWFWVETGIKLPDTQSGYRLYPVKALSSYTFFTRKYEFEIEVIVRAAWGGINVTHVPVKVFYPEKEKRITHFRPFMDVTRITLLNILFVFITYLYIKPRDFFRSFKKKIFGRTSESPLPANMSPQR